MDDYSSDEEEVQHSGYGDEMYVKEEKVDGKQEHRTSDLEDDYLEEIELDNISEGSTESSSENVESVKVTRHRRPRCRVKTCIYRGSFASIEELETHQREEHNTILRCHICLVEFVRSSSLTNHMKSHTSVVKTCADLDFFVPEKKKSNYNKFRCRRAGCPVKKQFDTKDEYNEHVVAFHPKQSEFPCRFCPKVFMQNGRRNDHEKRTHIQTVSEQHECPHCKKNITSKNGLSEHINRMHTHETKYECEQCDKVFYVKGRLRQHERTHLPEAPFKCNYCEKAFIFNSRRKKHEQIHTGEKPFTCEICDHKFRNLEHMKRHLRAHTGEKPYSCSFCDRMFTTSTRKVEHERTHTNEQPFSCNFCDKKFKTKKTYRDHERIHTGEKPYICRYGCEFAFTQINGRNSHEKSKHKDIYDPTLRGKETLFSREMKKFVGASGGIEQVDDNEEDSLDSHCRNMTLRIHKTEVDCKIVQMAHSQLLAIEYSNSYKPSLQPPTAKTET